jgi:arylsulfatase A-like enzyme
MTRRSRDGFLKSMATCLVLAAVLLGACSSPDTASPSRHLLIVIDGLRPDYVTPEVMPNLAALGRRGVVFRRHHSIYPTVTRVNASSISTGAYPGTHGLLGNSVFLPSVDATRFLDTSDRGELLKIAAAEKQLLTAPTLGETLHAAGLKMLVVSSGSTGSAFLINHTVAGGAILHNRFTLPESLSKDMAAINPAAPGVAPAVALDHQAVDAFLEVGIPRVAPAVTVMWLGALDSVAHGHGIGAPATVEVLRHVDAELKRLEDGLSDAGLLESYNIWVTSDHGFSTHTGGASEDEILKPLGGSLPDGSPRIVSGGGAIYVRDSDAKVIAQVVSRLQQTPGVGAIFTRGGGPDGFDGIVPGTLSFEAIRWNHDRSSQILFSPDWTDAANAFGMRGTTASGGVAGHGSSSPWDVHNTLIAAGPDLKQGATIDTPSANVDFAPTFLRLLGARVPDTMQGRPLEEALAANSSAVPGAVRTIEHTASTGDGSYSVTGNFTIVTVGAKEYRYFDGTRVVRR